MKKPQGEPVIDVTELPQAQKFTPRPPEEKEEESIEEKTLKHIQVLVELAEKNLDVEYPPSEEAVKSYLFAYENQIPPGVPPYKGQCYVPGRFALI